MRVAGGACRPKPTAQAHTSKSRRHTAPAAPTWRPWLRSLARDHADRPSSRHTRAGLVSRQKRAHACEWLAEHADPSQLLRRTPASLGDTQHRLHRYGARGCAHWPVITLIGRRVGTHERASSRGRSGPMRVAGGACRPKPTAQAHTSKSRRHTAPAAPTWRPRLRSLARDHADRPSSRHTRAGLVSRQKRAHASGWRSMQTQANCSGAHQQVSATHSTGCTDMAPVAALIGP